MATQNNNKLDNLSPEKRALVEKLLAKKKQQKLAQIQASKITVPDRMRTKGRLSFSQQRLWLLDQLEGGSAHYNIPSALHIQGKLDLKALKSAFIQIIDRHSVLRTQYVKQGDDAQQVVMPMPVEFCFEVIDRKQKLANVIRECGIEAAMLTVRAELELRTEYVFDLERDTSLRCHLWQLDEENAVLLILVHHIAADGWSMGVLTDELNQLYRQATMGVVDTLKPIDVQYLDYAQWQHEYLSGEVLERQLTYWQKQLANMPSIHNLPLDRARPSLPSYQGDTITTHIPMNLASSFKTLCNDYDATVFMGVYGALSVLLSRYSGEQDIVIGTTAANRDQTQVENLIGFFVNMLVLRQQHDDEASFVDILTQSKRIALDAFNHQQTPFEKVVERINPARDISYHPMFQVMLAVQNNQSSDLDLDGLSFSDVEIKSNNAKFDLSLNVEENESGLSLSWEYSTDLFNRASIENLANSFTLLLEAMTENPERCAFSVPLVDSKTRETELYAHNQTKQDYPKGKSVADLFEAQALLTPDAPAATFDGDTLSYRELDKRANALAHELQSRGVGSDD
ncbi:condensation domain-containing protein, partial [Vibrio sp. Of14-4]|uniref:condensation domain-containing protein n=1 Tax=Vibrio sp. Of14-4 TaxID=2724878 RepID=UPI001EF2C878